MDPWTRRSFERVVGACSLVFLAAAAHGQTFVGGPSVSSMRPGHVTVLARKDDNRYYSVDRTMFYRPILGGVTPDVERTAWTPLPTVTGGPGDFNSDPDSTVDLWQQWVVGRRSPDNGCWFATRPLPGTNPPNTVYPPWSGWTPLGGVFNGAISVAAVNYPDPEMPWDDFSAVSFVGRGTNNLLYYDTFWVFNNGTESYDTGGWRLVPGQPADGFIGDPDATAYHTHTGTSVAVCAQHQDPIFPGHVVTARVWCNSYDPAVPTYSGNDLPAWSGWSATQSNTRFTGRGPGLAMGINAAVGFDVYFNFESPAGLTLGVAWEPFIDGWGTPLRAFPFNVVTSSPDAATFADPWRGYEPSVAVCAKDTGNAIQCTLGDGLRFGTPFYPDK